MQRMPDAQAQITFLYYREMEPAASFYEQVLGLERVVDQGWARIYRIGGNAYLGVVAGEKGFHQPQQENAVLISLVVDDASQWYNALRARGVKLLSGLQHKEDIGLRCFFLEDPGGYALEVQQFLEPRLAEIFSQA
jgi:predicted enzyme related to lactoylglutathione lyase